MNDVAPRSESRETHSECGFTLIEMSIVLMIIGLIVGGILVGQELIKQAEVRSLLKQIEAYKTAVMVFRDKYNALPGDMANATQFWPADPACNAGVRPYMAAPNGKTCNGDGNQIIGPWLGYDVERDLFWNHLSLAGLISGSYTGACGDSTTTNCAVYTVTPVDVPTSPMQSGNTLITVANPDIEFAGWGWFWPVGGGHVFWLSGGLWADMTQPPGALTPKEAFSLDTKYDDGIPSSGSIMEGRNYYGCTNNGTTPPTYQTGTGNQNKFLCEIFFKGYF